VSVSPGPRRWARSYHLAAFAVTLFALVFQLWLVVIGEAVLIETEPPALSTRLIRFFSYFTIQ
jgi:hypothetical protein